MDIKKSLLMIVLAILSSNAFAMDADDDGDMDDLGQAISINTNLKSFKNNPSWTLIIRDVEHGQNIPYVFDFTQTENNWLAFTFGTDYTIVSSQLSFGPEGHTIENFCQVEGMGRLQHGKGMNIVITGKLTPRGNAYQCQVERYLQPHFAVSTNE